MMKILTKKELHNKIQKFDLIIFDLDNTIYDEKNYDFYALKKVAIYLENKINTKKDKIFKDLKILRLSKSNILIFNEFLIKFNLSKKEFKFLVKNSLKIFQLYNCKNLTKVSSLKSLIRDSYIKKDLFLVTNGHPIRQMNKINSLNIKKYFKKIFILDGKKKKLKPSIESVKYLLKPIKKFGNKNSVYIGDNLDVDKKFAKNLKISFLHFKFDK